MATDVGGRVETRSKEGPEKKKKSPLRRHKGENSFFNRLTRFAVVARTAGFAARPAR